MIYQFSNEIQVVIPKKPYDILATAHGKAWPKKKKDPNPFLMKENKSLNLTLLHVEIQIRFYLEICFEILAVFGPYSKKLLPENP